MVDYRQFLQQQSTQVLPWFRGDFVHLRDRRLRLKARPGAPGWYSIAITGREAVAGAKAEAPDLQSLPLVRGTWAGNRLNLDGKTAEVLHFLPEEELPRFAPVTARRWYSGELLFDSLEFENGNEDALRQALAKSAAISDLKGVTPGQRAAYALAVTSRVAEGLNVRFSPLEIQGHLSQIAEGGRAGAEAVLRELEEERAQARREMEELERQRNVERLNQEVRNAREQQREARRLETLDAEEREARIAADVHEARAARHIASGRPAHRAEAALEKAGATLESSRTLGNDRLEVIYEFMQERFISVVDTHTLTVIDSGICLGHPPRDDLVTLESLPSVIKEAIDTGQLVVLRHP